VSAGEVEVRGTVRSPGLVVLFAIITCGFYMIYWYFQTLGELNATGHIPTGNSPLLDFLIVVATCGVYSIYVDYRISKVLLELQEERGLPLNDTSPLVVLLDIFGLGVVGSAVHQNELNKIWGSATGA
jgi:hypothetical protein